MSRYALVAKIAPRTVRNVCLWDGDVTKWTPPADCDPVVSEVANVGDLYDPVAQTFTAQAVVLDPLDVDGQRIFDYMPVSGSAIAGQVSAFIQDGTKDPAIRATMAALRSLIRKSWKERAS